MLVFFFFFNDTATTEIYTLSLHDALPISRDPQLVHADVGDEDVARAERLADLPQHARRPHREGVVLGAGDRKSTRLNSSHANISYAVFCLKKKKKELRSQ